MIAGEDETDRSTWAQRYLCGTEVGREGTPPPKSHACHRTATRVSHVYERFSVYVCDADHEGLEPWTEDLVEDLPTAARTRVELAAEEQRRDAFMTFSRTIARLQRRASASCLHQASDAIRHVGHVARRGTIDIEGLRSNAEGRRRLAKDPRQTATRREHDCHRRIAFLYERAADALAKLRDALRCPYHGSQLDHGWQGWECEECERERLVAQGCRCGGTVRCPECIAARAAGTGEKCRPDCSDLCHVCCPDD